MLKGFGIDLIGDIHGCGASLKMLLERLGYRLQSGVYRHPQRKVIFLGDLIDRGPRIRETIDLVYAMVSAGEAEVVMGNHEYNYLCFKTPSKTEPDTYLRANNARHQRIVQATLDQFANHPQDERDMLSWISEMPLYIEKDDLRVVHACWHSTLIDRLRVETGPSPLRSEAFLHRSASVGSFESLVMDRLLRGTHLKLPNNEVMISEDGFKRSYFRTKFWVQEPRTLGDLVFQPDPLPEHIALQPIATGSQADLQYYGPEERPLFIGHFWCKGEPSPVAPNIACLDYSAVKFGKLVAYRFDGETQLDASKFVWIDVDREFPHQESFA